MLYVEQDDYERLRAIEQEAAELIEHPFQPWNTQQQSAYEKLCRLIHPDDEGYT